MINRHLIIEFGIRIKNLRLEKKWSQEDLSFRTGFHRTYIGMIERAEKNISLKNIQKVAKALNISIEDLFKGF